MNYSNIRDIVNLTNSMNLNNLKSSHEIKDEINVSENKVLNNKKIFIGKNKSEISYSNLLNKKEHSSVNNIQRVNNNPFNKSNSNANLNQLKYKK